MKILIYVMVMILTGSCVLRYDELTFYNKSYHPTCKNIRTDGYYYLMFEDKNRNISYQYCIFYKDGSCLLPSSYIDSNDFILDISQSKQDFDQSWGFCQCNSDSIKIEEIWKDVSSYRAFKLEHNGIVEGDSIFLFYANNNLKYHFVQSSLKPDSTLNWLKTHRKYRIR